MIKNIAVIIVGYNRVDSLSRLYHSLLIAYYPERADLIISIDKSQTDIVENYADNLKWDYGNIIVDKHDKNMGLRNHMMSLGKWFNQYDALIILEDDVTVAPDYFNFSLQCYDKYYNDDKIAGIGLYSYNLNYQNTYPFHPLKENYDVYMFQCAMSWGQLWLKKQWLDFYNWYLNNIEFTATDSLPDIIKKWPKSSWLKYHIKYCIEKDKYFVYPYYSLSTNFSEVGTHNKGIFNHNLFQVQLQSGVGNAYRLPSFQECPVKYDTFYNNIKIYQFLKLNSDECILDLYGTINILENKRYCLSTKILNYKVVDSFALDYRPIELNIFNHQKGAGIYLYDLNTRVKRNLKDSLQFVLYLYYIKDLYSLMRICGVRQYICLPVTVVIKKIISKIRHV